MRINLLLLSLLASAGVSAQQPTRVLNLDECKRIALENSVEVRNANLDLVAARAQKNEILTKWLPQVNASAWAFQSSDYLIQMEVAGLFNYTDFGYDIQSVWNEMYSDLGANKDISLLRYGRHAGISAIQPIFLGGRLVHGTRYALLGIEAAELQGSMAKRAKLEEVESNYFQITALQEKAKTLESLQSLVDSLEKVADVAYREGVILKADQMLLQTKKQELQNGKLKLRSGLKLLKMNLLNSMGMEYKVLELDQFEFPAASIDDVPSPEMVYVDEATVAESTQEHRLLELQVQAKKYEKLLTLGESLPMMGVGATYGTSMFSERQGWRSNGLVFVALRVPISDWGRSSFKMRRQQAAIDKAVNDREHLNEMLVLQQRKFYLELTSAWDALQLAKSQKEYGQYLYDQARISFDAGMTTITDLLQVYANLSTMEENYCTAVSDYLGALQVYRGRLPENK